MARHVNVLISETAFRQAGANGPACVAGQLRAACYLGRLTPGDRLPSVRQLARQLRISPTTALELYHELQAEGLVESRERSGMFLRARSGVEPSGPQAELFKMVAATAKRLELQGISSDEFVALLLGYTGRRLRPGVRFGFVGCREALDLLQPQLVSRLKFELPIVPLPPTLSSTQIVRELARDATIRGLIATLLSSEIGIEAARAVELPVVMLCLATEAARFFAAPDGPRLIVVRDRDFAEALRRLACNLAPPPEGPEICRAVLAAEACVCAPCNESLFRGVVVACLAEPQGLECAARETDTLYAPATSFDPVQARYRQTHRVVPLSLDFAPRSIDDLLFHYLFAEPAGSCEGSADRDRFGPRMVAAGAR